MLLIVISNQLPIVSRGWLIAVGVGIGIGFSAFHFYTDTDPDDRLF